MLYKQVIAFLCNPSGVKIAFNRENLCRRTAYKVHRIASGTRRQNSLNTNFPLWKNALHNRIMRVYSNAENSRRGIYDSCCGLVVKKNSCKLFPHSKTFDNKLAVYSNRDVSDVSVLDKRNNQSHVVFKVLHPLVELNLLSESVHSCHAGSPPCS